jgi:hypothetical protein
MPAFPPDAHLKGGAASAPVNAQLAREFYAPLLPIVRELRRQGLSLRAIARELERRGIKTRYEWRHWSATSVRRLLARAAERGGGDIGSSAGVELTGENLGPIDLTPSPKTREA